MNKNGDFIYTEVFGGVIITKYIGTDENVAIPEKINGKPVIYIDSSIFCNVAGILKSVEIYANITSIISGTFKNCTSLQSVDIPKSVKSISDDAFDGCDKIKINISAEIQIGKFLINPKFNSNVSTADKKILIPIQKNLRRKITSDTVSLPITLLLKNISALILW
jgi:hypothetical protein